MRLVVFAFLIPIFSFAQSDLFGIVKIGQSNHFVEFDTNNGTYNSILVFPAHFNDFLALTHDCKNDVFYTIGNSMFNEPSKLIRIHKNPWSFENLGTVNVLDNNQNLLASNVCQIEGLAFNDITNKLYASLNLNCSNYYSNRFVVFDFNVNTNFVNCNVIGQTQSQFAEFDMMTFAYSNPSIQHLIGVDIDPNMNTAFLQKTDFPNANPGYLTTFQTIDNYKAFRDLTFNQNNGLLYSFGEIQGQVWLRSYVPYYDQNAGQVSNETLFSTLIFNNIRGLSFACKRQENNDLSISSFEVPDFISMVYPNPFENKFHFESNLDLNEIQKIELFDYSGKLVYLATEEEILNKTISILNMSRGIYLVNFVLTNGLNQIVKLTKQ
jgi:hypothetical protein